MRKIIGTSGALVCAACLSACYESVDPAAQWNEQQEGLPAVEAVEVRYGTLPLEERLVGAVRARNQIEIYPEVAAPIVEVFVNDGQPVERGDPLVRLRATDFEERLRQAESGLQVADARVAQAEANLTRLETTLRRIETLTDRGLAPAADLDAARADALSAAADLNLMQAQHDQALAVVNERRAELDETLVRAPIEGVVGARNAEVGQQANTSTALFVIGDPSSMIVSVTLTQRMLGHIRVGTSVNVFTEAAPDQVLSSDIDRISPFLHPVAHTTTAEIDIGEHGGLLRPGMFVTADALYGETERAALVPNSAIYRDPRDGREGVFVAKLEDTLPSAEAAGYSIANPTFEPVGPVPVQFVAVDIVARGRDATAIDGVQTADWVVTVGHHLLDSGEQAQAVIQPTPWDHILRLQEMQSRDLLDVIREKQESREGLPETLN